jgi:hypothetical protein
MSNFLDMLASLGAASLLAGLCLGLKYLWHIPVLRVLCRGLLVATVLTLVMDLLRALVVIVDPELFIILRRLVVNISYSVAFNLFLWRYLSLPKGGSPPAQADKVLLR